MYVNVKMFLTITIQNYWLNAFMEAIMECNLCYIYKTFAMGID